MDEKGISRREFLKETGVGALGVGVLLPGVLRAEVVDYSQAPAVDKKELVAALGDTIIPTDMGYPGYRRLEQYGISEEVLEGLRGIQQEEWNVFNAVTGEFFQGKSFVELQEGERAEFLEIVAESFPADTFEVGSASAGKSKPAGSLTAKLSKEYVDKMQKVFRLTRVRVFRVFYQNFPEHKIARDQNKIPVLPAGDLHQIINPNTPRLVTGWDVANFPGPLSWEEEEARRAKWMKIHWHED